MNLDGVTSWLRNILGCQEDFWKGKFDASETAAAVMAEDMRKVISENNDLKNQLVTDSSNCPSWLDERVMPYIPNVSLPEGTVTLDNPREIYCSNAELKDMVVLETKGMTSDQKLTWAWYKVIDRLAYMYDVTDDWQFPIVSWYKRQGDCEDGTILFVELCRLAGITADSVFNACGWYKSNGQNFGHSYPIAKMADGKWYVFESTLDYHPGAPVAFDGNANYDDTWGDSNWKYAGKRKTSQVAVVRMMPGTLNFENDLFKDLDSKRNAEKLKAINSYWKGKK
jgi:hypothetical protein